MVTEFVTFDAGCTKCLTEDSINMHAATWHASPAGLVLSVLLLLLLLAASMLLFKQRVTQSRVMKIVGLLLLSCVALMGHTRAACEGLCFQAASDKFSGRVSQSVVDVTW